MHTSGPYTRLTHLGIGTESHDRPKALQITAVQYGEHDYGSSEEGTGQEGSSGEEGRSKEAGSEEEEVILLIARLSALALQRPNHRAPRKGARSVFGHLVSRMRVPGIRKAQSIPRGARRGATPVPADLAGFRHPIG